MRQRNTFRISNLRPPSSRFELAAGRHRLLAAKAYQTIYCLRGGLWITQEKDDRDYLLREGDAFIVPRSGKVMVQALGLASVGISPKALDDELCQAGFRSRLLK